MKPADVWVIMNKYTNEILWVGAEEFLAQRRWDFMVEHDTDNEDAVLKNRQKLVICTLARALSEINSDYKAQIQSIQEEKELTSRWDMI